MCIRENDIFSFECDNNIFDFLKKSIDKNNLTNVKLFNYFIGEESINNIKLSIVYYPNQMFR